MAAGRCMSANGRSTRRGIAAIHDAGTGRRYTVNDPARARALLTAGVDALITDAPADLRDGLADLPGIA